MPVDNNIRDQDVYSVIGWAALKCLASHLTLPFHQLI